MKNKSNQTILVVGEEAALSSTLAEWLQRWGFTPIIIATGADAPPESLPDQPRLALVNLQMAGPPDGFATARRLKAKAGVAGVIYLSHYADLALLEQARQTEPLGFLVKPVSAPQLFATLTTAINRLATEQQQAQRQRYERDELLRKLSEQIPGMICQFRLHPDGQITIPYSSQAIQEIFEVTPQQALQNPDAVFARINPDDLPGVVQALYNAAAHLQRWSREARVLLPHRGVRWLHCEATPEQEPDGSILWHGYIHDITERKQVELALQIEILLNQSITRLAETVLSPDLSITKLAQLTQRVALELTGSKAGFVSYLEPHHGDNLILVATKMMNPPETNSGQVVFTRGEGGYEGLWGHCLNTLTSFFTNDPARHPAARGVPPTHAPLRNFMAVPAIANGQLVGQIALANANHNYTPDDIQYIERIANIYALAILRRRYETELIAAKEQTETANRAVQASEARFRQLAENIEQVLWLRTNQQMIYINPAYETIFGRSCESLYQNPNSFAQLIHPDDRPRVTRAYQAQYEKGIPFNEEYRILRPDGHLRWIWARTFLFNVENSQDLRSVGLAQDITDAKHVQEALQAALEQTETLYTTLRALSAATDLPTVLRLILEELHKVVPYDSASVQVLRDGHFEVIEGAGFSDISKVIGLRFNAATHDIERQILETRRPVILNQEQIKKYIDIAHFEEATRSWLGVPLLFGDRVIGKLGIDKIDPDFFTPEHAELAMAFAAQAAVAIENARYVQETEQARQEAEAANRAKSQFLATMSHELRTPLNGILGYTQLLKQDQNLSPHHRQAIDTIHRSGQHLLLLINDSLDLAKIEAGRMELYPVEFQLPQFLQTLVDIIKVRVEQKGLNFTYEASPHLPVGILADEKRLRQILLNLLGNAIKFTDAGGIVLRVALAQPGQPVGADSTTRLRFVVADTGIGIAQTDVQLIFNAFQQAGNSARLVDGTGLGLTITQHLVQLMNGTLSVESEVGEGSQFIVEVPAQVTTVSGQAEAATPWPLTTQYRHRSNLPPATLPPAANLRALAELVQIGDISGIQLAAKRLHPDYPDFAREILYLAGDFRLDLIEAFLERNFPERG